MLKEFKEFAVKGNVMDLAVAVIIGAAFGKIVSSLVNDVIMPFVGLFGKGFDFAGLKAVITPATETTAEVAILYGAFIQTVIDFLLIALSVFFIVKLLGKLKKKEEEKPAEPTKPTEDVALLTEIRDLLKAK
ncbi:MAG: large-conductance mechanosensitive channel protein MscL [Clostridiales bacterium]|nr:large-conductance mechanosensitive channel protein MscL [Clostridiales bacterium]